MAEAVGRVPADTLPYRCLGGMRWGRLNATIPFARLTIAADGITGGPSVKFLCRLVPTVTFCWAELTRIEPVGWAFLPILGDGVRFSAFGASLTFWTGSTRRSARLLDICESRAPGLVSRVRQRPPIFGS